MILFILFILSHKTYLNLSFQAVTGVKKGMRFAHFADCHVGGWQDPRMKDLTIAAFRKAVDERIARRVDFLLIAGDLFNTALPQIDLIKDVAGSLKKINDAGIKVYIIAGSHDFSPSRKTMLDVLEHSRNPEGDVRRCHSLLKRGGLLAINDSFRNRQYCTRCGDNVEISAIELSYAFKLLLDELKSMCINPRLMLGDKY